MAREVQIAERHRDRLLRYAALLYAIGLVLHSADHLRRGPDVLTPEVTWAGAVTTIMGVIVITLVFTHRLAPLAAVAFGVSNAAGVGVVHLLPHWSAFSDAFPGGAGSGVGATSWDAVLIEIAGLLALAAAGTHLLMNGSRSSGLAAGTTS